MSYLIAYLGTTGLVDVGYRFFDTAGIYTGARQTAGIVELPGSRGVYFVPSPTIPATATGVYWDSTGTAAAYAYEVFNFRTPNVDTATAGALITSGTGTAQLSVASGVASANAVQISGDSGAADSLEAMLDGTGAALALTDLNVSGQMIVTGNLAVNSSVTVSGNIEGDFIGGITGNITGNLSGSVGSVAAGGITAASIATGAIDADALAADAGTEIGTAVWATGTRTLSAGAITSSTFGAGAITSTVIAADAIGASQIAADAIGSSELATSAVNEITAATDTVLTAAHSAGSWGTPSGTGANPITVTVTDGTDPLQNATVTLHDGATFIGSLTTDASGNATFSLATGTYTVALTKANYTFTPTTRTVTGNQAGTLVNDLEMTIIDVVTPPSSPTLCVIYGTLVDGEGDAVQSATGRFVLKLPSGTTAERPAVAGGNVITTTAISFTTNASGAIKAANGTDVLEVIRTDEVTPAGCFWEVTCSAAGIARRSLTLAVDTFDVADL